MKTEGWHYFGQGDFPQDGQEVTIIWNDAGETDCIWMSDGMDWNAEIIPIAWKPLNKETESNETTNLP